jgi:hypothetical protein
VNPIIKAALAARTRADIDALEAMIVEALGIERSRFLGDQEANWSSISSPAEAQSIVWERFFNMIDTMIELEARRKGKFDFASPAEAAAGLFGITNGVGGMTGAERAKIAQFCKVTVLDSDDSVRRPTISFRDNGTGVTAAEMPDTILSLQRSNKLRKPYTHGIFGKGGSSACAFSDATIIIGRKHPDLLAKGEPDEIAIAVVREDDAADMGLPFYRYLVGPDGPKGLPYSFPASEAPKFEPGVYVAHVNYQAGKMGLQNWQNEESIYAMAETIIFAPTMPYHLEDARTGSANVRPESRQKPSVLSGLQQRLEQLKAGDGVLLGRSGWQTVPVPGVGDVRMRWMLFEDLDKRRQRVAKGYVVVFTTNGQVHHVWDQARFQQVVERRRRVSTRLFVEVDCDSIEAKARWKVFDSFRAQVRRGPEGRALEEAVADAILSDADLDEFESVFVQQSLKGTSQNISQGFRDRLNRALKTRIPGLGFVEGKGIGPKPPKAKPAIELYDEPTTMTGPETVTLLRGDRAEAYLEINARDGFVPTRGTITIVASEGKDTPTTGVGDLRKGRLRLSFIAAEDFDLGDQAVEAVLAWERVAGKPGQISWPMTIKVVAEIAAKPPAKPKGAARGSKPKDGDVAFVWVNGALEGWAADVVGELQDIKGSDLATRSETYADLKNVDAYIPTIVLNKDFADFAGYKATIAKRLTDDTLAVRDDRYGLGVGVAVANLALGEKKIKAAHDAWEAKQNGTEEPPKPMTEDQFRRALVEAARGIVALMPDFDKLLNDFEESAA